MKKVDDFRLKLGSFELVPIITGGMGVHFSGPELALEISRLGGVGHITDAMVPFVSDMRYGTSFTQKKRERNQASLGSLDKTSVKFELEDIRRAQINHVSRTMERKQGAGAIFINVMEKLGMADPVETLRARLNAALDGGIDGVTLGAGLHCHSLKLMEDNPRFRDAKIGIIVSSARALKIFMRGASRIGRLPDYIIIEGPLAGGHLGFGEDWREHDLRKIVREVIALLKEENLDIPVIPAGGIFTGGEAAAFLEEGAAAVQVATRFVVAKECGVSEAVKQRYFAAKESDVQVNHASPTGYLMRMLADSPCLNLKGPVSPNCEAFGYVLDKEGRCQYLEACVKRANGGIDDGCELKEKVCLCHHFSNSSCYTCGHNVYRLKETTLRRADGSFQLLSAEHVFRDYQFSSGDSIMLPAPESQESKPGERVLGVVGAV